MYDYHSHSSFSDDSTTPLYDMIHSAIEKGILELAVTDHYDPDYPDKNFPFELDFPGYHSALLQAEEEFARQIKIVKGIEIGIQHGETNTKCLQATQAFPYDFVIGSFHCTSGEDLYTEFFKTRSAEKGIKEYYEYVLQGIQSFTDFDVMGHFNVIDRYSPLVPDYKPFMEIIEAILIQLIQSGKGIEINTSSFRYGLKERTTPSMEILSMYKELGGEIITIGSDAHSVPHLGFMYKEATEMLDFHGFRFITTYRNRVPSQVKY